MIAKKIKSKTVEKGDYKIYLNKAREFYEIMLKAKEAGKWTAVGLNAVHCVISCCCDALLVFHLGIRSMGDDHGQVAELLVRLPLKDLNREAAVFKRIIAKKNVIAYENREFREMEAIDILKLTERFYRWTIGILPA